MHGAEGHLFCVTAALPLVKRLHCCDVLLPLGPASSRRPGCAAQIA